MDKQTRRINQLEIENADLKSKIDFIESNAVDSTGTKIKDVVR